MAHPFQHYEVEVLEILLAPEYSSQQLAQLLDEAALVRVEYTNYGFYVSVKNPGFGKDRRVYSTPLLIGRLLGWDAGFVVFLEDSHLTLEIHPWGEGSLPATFRDGDVRVIRKSANKEN